jgi:hypothetical protein
MACYLSGSSDRKSFEGALHDVLMQGLWDPFNYSMTDQEYADTGNWEPFRAVLWNAFGPWSD